MNDKINTYINSFDILSTLFIIENISEDDQKLANDISNEVGSLMGEKLLKINNPEEIMDLGFQPLMNSFIKKLESELNLDLSENYY